MGGCHEARGRKRNPHRPYALRHHSRHSGRRFSKMLTPFRMGIGGKIGDGKQWMSWIALDDVVAALKFLIADKSISGPVNVVAPNPVTNAEFTRTLGRTLSRPTIFPMPAFGARLAFGEMADALLLSSQKVAAERARRQRLSIQLAHTRTSVEKHSCRRLRR